MTLETQSQHIKENAHTYSKELIEKFIREFKSYNCNTYGAYDDIIEFLENELANR